MQIQDILQLTSTSIQQTVLESLIVAAFQNEEGKLDFDQEVSGGDFVDTFAQQIAVLRENAKANKESLEAILKEHPETPENESVLDDVIDDACSGTRASINNQGLAGQIRHLLVEDGQSPEAIKKLLS